MTDTEQIILAGTIPQSAFADEDLNGLDRAISIFKTKHGIKRHVNSSEILAIAKKEAGSNKKRLQIIERLHQLPKDIVKGLIHKRLQIVDAVLFSTYKCDGGSFELIPTDKAKATGLRNFTNAKYDKQFLVQEIGILYTTSNDPKNARYNSDLPDEITNGSLTVKAGDKVIVNELPIEDIYTPMATFVGNGKNRYNRKPLTNPKWFFADNEITATLKLANPLTNGHVKVIFGGQEISNY